MRHLNIFLWPQKYRRLFLLMLPISFPLWLLAQILTITLAVFVLAPIALLFAFWIEVILPLWKEG